MSKRQLTTADMFTTEEKIKKICSPFKSVLATTSSSSSTHTDTKSHRLSHIQTVQNFILIWLDAGLYEESTSDFLNTVFQFRSVVNTVKTFTDTDQCIDFLTDIRDEKVFIILSASLAKRTVPFIHDIPQLDSIYILSKNKSEDGSCWTDECTKVKDVFSEISLICEKLKPAAQQLDQNNISISFAPNSGATSNQGLDKLDQSFMHTQMLKEILLEIVFAESHIKDFIDYCRLQFTDNSYQISRVEQFERTYHEHSPIWWYTSEFFLHSMLNRALRLMDVDIIVKLGFYISDLHHQINQLHLIQLIGNLQSQPFTLYRGQGLTKTDFDEMMKKTGGLMSFNNFLSTSKDHDVSNMFAKSNQINRDCISVLFEITVDPSKISTPFAFVNEVSFYETENEILFSMHAVFRINNIEQMVTDTRLWKVKITLTSDNDQELTALREHMQKDTERLSGWHKLVLLFINLGQFTKAQNIIEIISDRTTSNEQSFLRFYLLGRIESGKGQYTIALAYHQKVLGIRQEDLPANHNELAFPYSNIGQVYSKMGQYSKALSYYDKALEIRQEALPANHPDLATSYCSVGQAYSYMGEYTKALSYYEKALGIRQESLPIKHPDLATSYCNIGQMYCNMGAYPKALSYNEKALGIYQESLPANHPDLATSYCNIGQMYCNMGEYPKALSYNEKALGIRQESLPIKHPDLATSYGSIGQLYSKMGEYSKALLYHEKALGIRQEYLPANHPYLATTYNNIGQLYLSMGEQSKAVSFHERAIDIGQRSLPEDHPHLQIFRENLKLVRKNL